MSEDLTKGKKRKRRSLRAYVNANKPLDPSAERLIGEFRDDDCITPAHEAAVAYLQEMKRPANKREFTEADRRRLAREGHAVVSPDGNISYPIETVDDLRNAADHVRMGHGDVDAARRLIARRSRELGVANPLDSTKATGNPYDIDASNRQVNSRELAFRHPDLRQSDPAIRPFTQVSQRAGGFMGQAAFGALDGSTARVQVNRLDAGEMAGDYRSRGDCHPGDLSGNPNRAPWHTAPIGASNGSHDYSSQAGAASTPRQSMKNSDALAIMKRELFGHD